MIRDPARLADRTFDVLIIGGGIYGLTMAYDAAARGLSVALVERGDFGGGSSFNHLRTIHGGLRHLQTLDLAHARESIRERRTLARIAPHLVRPLPFVLPLTHRLLSGPTAMRAGFLLDRLVAADRNDGVAPSHYLPAGRVLSRAEARARFPDADPETVAGAARWHDYVVVEADRLTFAWAEAAARHGATLLNYTDATALVTSKGRVVGARVTDRCNARPAEVLARVVLNATGGGVNQLLRTAGMAPAVPLLMAMNLVTSRPAPDEALGGPGGGRNLFLVPWRGRALFGTSESVLAPTERAPGGASTGETALVAFVDQINQAFPGLQLSLDEVSLVHRGVVPAAVRGDGTPTLRRHELVQDHAGEGAPGLITVAGTKYTTARAVAERVVDRLVVAIGLRAGPCRTAAQVLPGADIPDTAVEAARAARHLAGVLPADTAHHLVAAYGTRWEEVATLAASHPDGRTRIAAGSPVIGAQLLRAVRDEMAVTLCDAVIRRTPLGALGYPGDEAAQRAADLVGAELGWTADRKASEVAALKRFFSLDALAAAFAET